MWSEHGAMSTKIMRFRNMLIRYSMQDIQYTAAAPPTLRTELWDIIV